jgi:maltoporin
VPPEGSSGRRLPTPMKRTVKGWGSVNTTPLVLEAHRLIFPFREAHLTSNMITKHLQGTSKGRRALSCASRAGHWLGHFVLLLSCSSTQRALAETGTPTEAEQIRQELRTLRLEYERRMHDLEERLRRLEVPVSPAVTNLAQAAPVTNAAALRVAVTARQFAEEEFQRDTESRERALLTSTNPITARVDQVLQDFLDIHGYFRAGYGRNDQGGSQVAFQAPGAFSKYRLGNEAETYGELTFGKNFYVAGLFKGEANPSSENEPVGPLARVQTTMSVYNPYQELLNSSSTDFGLPEIWGAIGNVVPAQPSMKFWAGSRYYRRHDIHITDFFFYNMSGTGGGVEDFELPFGKLALAWIGGSSSSGFSDLPEPDPNNKAGFSKGNWDLRLYDVPLPLGKGEFALVYVRADSGKDALGNSAPGSDGLAFTFLHTREAVISPDGVNKFSLQFGTGPAKTFTSGFETFTTLNGLFIRPDVRDSWRFRATEHFTANVSDSFSIGPALVYQLTDYADGTGKTQWASAGLRPIWHFNRYLSLAGEAGVDYVHNDSSSPSGYLYKFTLAPQVSLGGRFMSRPVLRGFVTYASWSADFTGQVGGNDYLNETEGLTYGIQMEAWW